jgi:hypothetical protein
MTTRGEADTRRPRRRRNVAVVAIVTCLAVAAFSWHTVSRFWSGSDTSAPSCSWPAHVQDANSAQDGLIRCYLQAVADRSTSELRAVVPARSTGGPIGFGSAVFAHAADARSGTADVMVIGNSVDDADATVAIRYADQAQDNLEIHLADPASASSWRFWNIGVYAPDPSAPSPAIR